MTLLVRDEEDIIRTNIDYHFAQGVDFILATDNLSRDRTPSILREYERAGKLKFILETDDTYAQGVWVTRMARQAYTEFGADWVINSDADEFWWPLQGNLKDALARVPSETQSLLASRFNFIMEKRPFGQPFYARMRHREVASFNPLGAPLPQKMAHRGSSSVEVGQGNHTVEGLIPGRPAEGILDILHFPVRSYGQMENKIAKGGAAYARNTSLPQNLGNTWRALHRELQEHGHLKAYFATVEHDASRRIARQAAGEVVEDLRLIEFLRSRGLTPSQPSAERGHTNFMASHSATRYCKI